MLFSWMNFCITFSVAYDAPNAKLTHVLASKTASITGSSEDTQTRNLLAEEDD